MDRALSPLVQSPLVQSPLFQRLLGDAYAALAPRVRELHGFDKAATWRGRATVRRGGGVLARLCAAVAGLPPSLDDAPTRVAFAREGEGETWSRDFGGHPMRSSLRDRGGLLCERLGPLAFAFELSARDGELHWLPRRVRLLGLLPLPAAWFSGVRCREREHAGRYEFLVEAALPLAGPLIRYEGWLEHDGSDLRGAPAIAADRHPIVVFDGVCVLCNGWVRFLLRHDRVGRYRFAAMQSDAGRTLLAVHGLDPDDPVSFLLVEGAQAWTDTEAIVRVLSGLGGFWRAARLLRLLPKRLRDAGYRAVARNRYRWFGRHESCVVPPVHARERFLDGRPGTDVVA